MQSAAAQLGRMVVTYPPAHRYVTAEGLSTLLDLQPALRLATRPWTPRFPGSYAAGRRRWWGGRGRTFLLRSGLLSSRRAAETLKALAGPPATTTAPARCPTEERESCRGPMAALPQAPARAGPRAVVHRAWGAVLTTLGSPRVRTASTHPAMARMRTRRARYLEGRRGRAAWGPAAP